MVQNEVRSSNDVELVVSGINERGTPRSMGRIIVDDFSLSREQDSELAHGVGYAMPAGIVDGQITFSGSFTLLGEDRELLDNISDRDGNTRVFSVVARSYNENDEVVFEQSLDYVKATAEEFSASSGDAVEFSVDYIAVAYERQ